MNRLLQGVIFDMDGLMFDTERLSACCWEQVGREFGLDITESFLVGVRGMTRREFQRIFEQRFGDQADYETVMGRKTELFQQEIRQNGVPVKPGLPELLVFLREQRVSAAMATATNQEIARRYLSGTGLTAFFDQLIFGDQVHRGKPDPEIFLCAAQMLGALPEHCVVLEDSLNGVLAGIRGGFRTIMVPDMTQPSPELERKLFRKCEDLFQVIECLRDWSEQLLLCGSTESELTSY